MTVPKCFSLVSFCELGCETFIYSCSIFIGELERTFLVLRETVALRRAGKDVPAPVDMNAPLPEFEPEDDVIPGPENNPKNQADQRGVKRVASVDHGTPSKRR